MKVVFLDVDGVLLPFGEGAKLQEDPSDFSPESMAALERILDESNADIVLSSTWRCAGGDAVVLEQFGKHSKGAGRLGEQSKQDSFEYTTDPNTHTQRQWEIGEWLQSAGERGLPEVEAWVAIDDEELVSTSKADGGGDFNARYRAAFQGRYVKTVSSVGLTGEHVEVVLAALERPWSSSELGSSSAGKDKADAGQGLQARDHAQSEETCEPRASTRKKRSRAHAWGGEDAGHNDAGDSRQGASEGGRAGVQRAEGRRKSSDEAEQSRKEAGKGPAAQRAGRKGGQGNADHRCARLCQPRAHRQSADDGMDAQGGGKKKRGG